MIERVIRYSTMSITATTKDKNQNRVYKEYLSSTIFIAISAHAHASKNIIRSTPLDYSHGALGEVCFFSLTPEPAS
jgi:hypothetical protein